MCRDDPAHHLGLICTGDYPGGHITATGINSRVWNTQRALEKEGMPLHPLLLIPELLGAPGEKMQPFVMGKLRAEPEEGGHPRWGHFGVCHLCSGDTQGLPAHPFPCQGRAGWVWDAGWVQSINPQLSAELRAPMRHRLCFVHRGFSSFPIPVQEHSKLVFPKLAVGNPAPEGTGDQSRMGEFSWEKKLPSPLPGRAEGFAPCQIPNPKCCLHFRILLNPLISLIVLITQQQRAETAANPSGLGAFISSA